MHRIKFLAAFAAFSVSSTAFAGGSFLVFDNLADFEAAAGPTVLEDLNTEAAPFELPTASSITLASTGLDVGLIGGFNGDVTIQEGGDLDNIDDSTFLDIFITSPTDSFPTTITLTFPEPSTGLAFDVGNAINSDIDLIIRDVTGGDLVNVSANLPGTEEGFFGVIFDTPRTSVQLGGSDNGSVNFEAIGIDNLRFTGTPAIPEPASLALIGLGGVGLIRRR